MFSVCSLINFVDFCICLFPDPPGKANITGPRYVLVGQEAVLNCHVADKGKKSENITYSLLNTSFNWQIKKLKKNKKLIN